MTRFKTSPAPATRLAGPPQVSGLRSGAAWMLMGASAALDHLAQRLVTEAVSHEPLPCELEFYAQAGAPEGALYVDGQFVGWLQGVTRL